MGEEALKQKRGPKKKVNAGLETRGRGVKLPSWVLDIEISKAPEASVFEGEVIEEFRRARAGADVRYARSERRGEKYTLTGKGKEVKACHWGTGNNGNKAS